MRTATTADIGPPPQPTTAYTAQDFLTVLFKRRRLVLGFFVVAVGLIALRTFLMADAYESTATILVKKGRAEVPMAARESAQLIMPQVTIQDLNSEIEILRSEQIIRDALQTLGTDKEPEPVGFNPIAFVKSKLGASQLSHFERTVLYVERTLEIRPVGKSNLIEVSFRSSDPEWATQIVQTIAEGYLERRHQIYKSPQAVLFFDEQAKEAEQRLLAAEQRMAELLQEDGVTMLQAPDGSDPLAAQKGQMLNRLGRLEGELAQTESTLREQEQEVASIAPRLEAEPERLASSDRFNQDSGVEDLERGLVALELRRDQLAQVFSSKNRQVQDIEAQIKLARDRLLEAEQKIGSLNRTEINPIHQTLRSDLLRAQTELEGTRARHTTLKRQVESTRHELASLNKSGFEFERLRRDVLSAKESYLLYQKKHEEARISAAMDQQKIVNVVIAEPARRPVRPLKRNTSLNLALGLVLGTVGGIAVAFGVDHFDQTVTSGQELERKLGIPHLASIPETK